MSQLDDDLLAALRAARPDPGYQPSATSPDARAMLARVLRSREDRAVRPRLAGLRWRPRPLLLAGPSAVAGPARPAPPRSCLCVARPPRARGPGLRSAALLAPAPTPAVIGDQIASGGFTVAGTMRLQGRPAIELTWSRRFGPNIVMTTRLWVDARTYLPLQSVTTRWIGHPHLQVNGKRVAPGRRLALSTDTTQYHILPATPANLALLPPPTPSGFTRTAPH